jgi:hypothetical protein
VDKETIQKIFDILYPELEIIIKEIEILPRNQLNENNEWVEDTSAYFVGVILKEFPSRSSDISEIVSMYTGFEFNVYRM